MLVLRPITVGDAEAIASAVDQSRDALRRWMPWYRDDYDISAAQDWIAEMLAGIEAEQSQVFVIISGCETLVGVIALEGIDAQRRRAMIGYWLATPMTGQHLGRRAVGLALDWARTQHDIETVWAIVAEGNLASRRVLEVNGFRHVGTRGFDERGDRALLYEVSLDPGARS